MSILQNDVKSILVPLLKGEKATLFKKPQATLASWIAMFTMVAEFQSIGYHERQNWRLVYAHNTLPVSTGSGSIHHSDDGSLPNTQTTTFVVGKLYVHVLSTAVRGVINRQRIQVPGVAQL
jgi:hypothetical protein